MFIIHTWPQHHALVISSDAYDLLINTLTIPFDSFDDAEQFWYDTQCKLTLYPPHTPSVMTEAQCLCFTTPDFIEYNDTHSLYCRIVGDAGGGDFLLIQHT